MVLTQFDDCIRIAGVDRAQKFLGLTMKLLQIWPGWAGGGRAWRASFNEPVVRWRRAKEVRRSRPNVWRCMQVDSVLSADGGRPVTPRQ
jgi:hypothetical protein